MNHSFDIDRAIKYGVPQAIILENMLFWLAHNKAFGKNIHDGKVWTYNSVAAYAELFPYWTIDQIRRYFESLEKDKVLIAGNFNKKKYDKTKWHTVNDQSLIPHWQISQRRKSQKDLADLPDALGELAEPIPDIKTDERQIADSLPLNPRTFEHKNTPKKSKVVSDQECNHILNIMREHDKWFNRTQEIIKLITQSIKHNGFQETEKAVKGRLMVKKGKDKSWRWLFVGNSDYLDALAAYDKENAADEDMRKRWSPEPTQITSEELSELEARLAEI